MRTFPIFGIQRLELAVNVELAGLNQIQRIQISVLRKFESLSPFESTALFTTAVGNTRLAPFLL